MRNIEFFVVSLMLIWILLTGYLGYLHLKLHRLSTLIRDLKQETGEE